MTTYHLLATKLQEPTEDGYDQYTLTSHVDTVLEEPPSFVCSVGSGTRWQRIYEGGPHKMPGILKVSS
jgi:hypothetical protein